MSVLAGGLACAGGGGEEELTGRWRLVEVCIYEQTGPPCEAVPRATAEVITFSPGRRFERERPEEQGTYRLESRETSAGSRELLVRFDDGSPAQVTRSADTLVISWAWVDGAEMRYVPDGDTARGR